MKPEYSIPRRKEQQLIRQLSRILQKRGIKSKRRTNDLSKRIIVSFDKIAQGKLAEFELQKLLIEANLAIPLLPGLDFYCFLKKDNNLIGTIVKLNQKWFIYKGFDENEIRIPFNTQEDLFEYVKINKYKISL